MPPPTLFLSQLTSLFRRLRYALGLELLALCTCLPFLLLTPSRAIAGGLLVLLWTCYLFRLAWRLWTHHSILRNLDLEGRFLHQKLSPLQLRRCFADRLNLWHRSCILNGLANVQACPVPLMLKPAEQTRRLAFQFHRALKKLHPPALWPDLLLLLLIFHVWAFTTTVSRLQLTSWTVGIGFLASCVLLFAVVARIELVWQTARTFDQLAYALADWVLDENLPDALREEGKPYRHRLLYRTPPWLSRPSPRYAPTLPA